ncbi:MAG: sulfotransferase domain-containing protein [Acidobacteriota bacterium]
MNNRQAIAIAPSSRDQYGTVQQEVDLGASALVREDAEMAIIFFQSALQKLSIRQPFHDHLVHNLLLSYKLLIEQKLTAGDEASAKDKLHAALRLEILGDMATDEMFRQRFAGAFQDLGIIAFKFRQFEESVACCRKAISIYAGPGSHVNLTNALTASGQRGVLSDFTNAITREQLGRHVFIACSPKSGSTFLKTLLLGLTGYRDAFMVNSASQFEQELYLPTLRKTAPLDTVTQQHCRASDVNIQMMQAFGIKPVVLVRNIFDSVISLLDFYNGGASSNSYFREDYPSLDAVTKLDLIIDNFVPWYFQFAASWSLAEKQKTLEVLWLSYEDLVADKSGSIQKVLRFYGLGAPLKGIEKSIEETELKKGKTRFNKGVAGRGKTGLSDKQKERIVRLARYYPATDFTRFGI